MFTSLQSLVDAAASVLAVLVISSTTIWLVTAIVARICASSSAAARHRLWGVSMLAVLASAVLVPCLPVPHVFLWSQPDLPEITPPRVSDATAETVDNVTRVPQVEVPSGSPTTDASPATAVQLPINAVSPATRAATDVVPSDVPQPIVNRGFSIPSLAMLVSAMTIVWLIGVVVHGAMIALSMVWVRQLMLKSIRLANGREQGVANALCRQLKIRRPVQIVVSTWASVPFVAGWWRPTIVLPSGFGTWTAERLRVVLLHELMHVRRADGLWQLIARWTLALVWFQPLGWLAARRLHIERELACDDGVLAEGECPIEYASHLVSIAASLQGRLTGSGSVVAMACRSTVEDRVRSILDPAVSRRRVGWRSTLADAVGMSLLLTLTAVVTPSFSHPALPADKIAVAEANAADAPKPATTVSLLVRSSGELLVDMRLQTKDDFKLTLQRIKQAGQSLAIRAESDVAKDQLCWLLRECRRFGIEPTEFAEPNGLPILHYAGTVVDPAGNLVAGAKIVLSYYRETPRAPNAPPETETDGVGQFEFIRRIRDFDDAAEDGAKKSFIGIVAIKEGFGFAIGNASFCLTTNRPPDTPQRQDVAQKLYRGTPNVLRLVNDDAPIHGRIVDKDGKPVANAKIGGVNTHCGDDGTLDAWEAACLSPQANYYSARSHLKTNLQETYKFGFQAGVIPVVHTDSEGWFTLRGIGRERIEHIIVSGPGIESVQFNARTREGQTITLSHDTTGRPESAREIYYPREFTVAVGPSQTVAGRITDIATGKPLAGIIIRGERLANKQSSGWLAAGHVHAVSDQDGRYRLTGLPIGSSAFLVLPPRGSPCFPAEVEVTTVASSDDLVRDIALTSGVVLRGKVTDDTRGLPVRGFVQYLPDAKSSLVRATPRLRRGTPFDGYSCDAQGRFALPVLPGPGVLTFAADNHRIYPRSFEIEGQDEQKLKDAEALINGPGLAHVFLNSYHCVVALQIPSDATDATENITLHSGSTVTGRVVSADGKPVRHYYFYGDTAPTNWHSNPTESFNVYGYFPKKGRRLMFWDPKTNEVGLRDLVGDVTGPIEVVLRPGGTIVGRVIDEQGNPVPKAVFSHLQLNGVGPAAFSLVGSDRGGFILQIDSRPVMTDQDGHFELSGVIPGLTYSAHVSIPAVVRDRKTLIAYPLFRDIKVQPGETKDLGDVKPE